ncbi:hypothetical protein HR11_07740 [Porphyromonas macacae]|uniref:ribosome assembly cofactor RimP n=1 Tax=Porphyromonas macacae TaxID=28115 RepID=UPI00052D31A1|nr:ribosome assembly cofactor RimP [Porphyromonas macacae]KGO00080.1 hypothetical protein HR11_07740 [Porphyromonas macacae]
MIQKSIIEKLVNHFLSTKEDENLFLVQVDVKAANNIEVVLDKLGGVSIDECVELSRFIESNLDRETEDFGLEVSSAGLTSPLRILRQYQNTLNEFVEVLVKGGKKEKGILKSVDELGIVLAVDRQVKLEGSKRKQTIIEDIAIKMEDILQTKRVIELKKREK